jgi:hypothetical protein
MKRSLALIAAIAACAHFAAKHALNPPPEPSDRIKIPHERHAKAKVDCIACHEGIWDDKNFTGADLLPKETKCLECHKEEKEKQNCNFCHSDVAHAANRSKPEPQVMLSHQKHVELTKEDCKRCHTSLPEPFADTTPAPTMNGCLSCHEHSKEYAQASCTGCHPSLARFPLRPIGDFSHQGNFVRGHAAPARSSAETCAQCHDQTYCSDCHAKTVSMPVEVKFPERVTSQFIHRNDFLGRHSLEAAADPVSCRRCHGTSFCESCHQNEGLVPAAASAATGRNPHPASWGFPGARDFHGDAARRDIVSCASCHDQGPRSNCVTCHRVGGVGGNPHPPSWTQKHGVEEIRTNAMCGYCHL